jgi:hypothetical protein
MSNRGTITVFRGVSGAAVCARLAALAPGLPAFEPSGGYEARYVEWRIDVAASDTVAVISQPLYSSGVPVLIRACAAAFECPWMELDQVEGDHWDYRLYRGAEFLHDFSTFHQYWTNDPKDAEPFRGDAAQLASVWGVPVEQVAPYLRNWGERPDGRIAARHKLRGKARPGDEFPYGDMWQILDFLRALGSPRLEAENWTSVTVTVPDLVYVPNR